MNSYVDKSPWSEALLDWYASHKRTFSWRQQNDLCLTERVYRVWVCEVMSQQTLLSVVIPKFEYFLKILPNVQALAICSDDVLRQLWTGLGYYARARNLREGARFLISQSGELLFPKTQKEWLKVPGCGPYTSAILASVCFGEPVAAVDGNVIRVASRLLAMDKGVWDKNGLQKIQIFVNQNISLKAPGDFNQAMMDLGATVCKKAKPLCGSCPIQKNCLAFQKAQVEKCPPVKPRKKAQQEEIYAVVLWNKKHDSVSLVHRQKGFLKKTTGFPLFAAKDGFSFSQISDHAQKHRLPFKKLEGSFKHTITHHRITGHVLSVECDGDEQKFLQLFSTPQETQWIPRKECAKHLSSSLDVKVLKMVPS